MTVREAAKLIKSEPGEMKLVWDGSLLDFDPQDRLYIDAFGKYEVDSVSFCAYKDGNDVMKHIEVAIATAPIIGKEAAI